MRLAGRPILGLKHKRTFACRVDENRVHPHVVGHADDGVRRDLLVIRHIGVNQPQSKRTIVGEAGVAQLNLSHFLAKIIQRRRCYRHTHPPRAVSRASGNGLNLLREGIPGKRPSRFEVRKLTTQCHTPRYRCLPSHGSRPRHRIIENVPPPSPPSGRVARPPRKRLGIVCPRKHEQAHLRCRTLPPHSPPCRSASPSPGSPPACSATSCCGGRCTSRTPSSSSPTKCSRTASTRAPRSARSPAIDSPAACWSICPITRPTSASSSPAS